MLDLSRRELSFALELAEDGSRLARDIQETMAVASLEKEDRSPVTVADFAIQALAASRLKKHFPGEALVAEESSEVLRGNGGRALVTKIAAFLSEYEETGSSQDLLELIDRGQGEASGERFWVLDPIDGTKGFLRDAHYAVALALIERDRVVLGVLGCPRLAVPVAGIEKLAPVRESPGTLLLAVRGEGCYATVAGKRDLRRLSVSREDDLEKATPLRSVERGHTNVDQFGALMKEIGVRGKPVLMDSQAKYALLAAGVGDFLLRLISPTRKDYREKIWDQAAGSIVVEEAGGRVTDLDGRALDFSHGRRLERNRGVLATNGVLHSQLLPVLKQMGV